MVSGRAADAAHRSSKRVRLIQAGLAVVGIAALGVLAGTWFGADHGGVTNQAAAADRPNLAGGPNATACQVRYLTMSDAKGTFMVEITVRNSGGQALIGWSLVFVLDGDQRLVQVWSADWTQAGRTVTARSGAAGTQLRAGGSTTIGFTAQYAKANPLPGGFTLNGQECSYSAVGGTGETKSGGPSPGRGNAGGVPGSPTGGGGPGGTPGGFATDGGPGAPPPTDPGVPVPTISPPPSDTGGPTDDPGGGPPEHGPSKKPKPSHKELDLVVVPEAYQVEVLPLR